MDAADTVGATPVSVNDPAPGSAVADTAVVNSVAIAAVAIALLPSTLEAPDYDQAVPALSAGSARGPAAAAPATAAIPAVAAVSAC